MDTVLSVSGSLIAASGTIPYIIATIKHRTKPRIVTWFTWALLTGLASAAAFSDGQTAAGFFALLGAISTGAIVLAGLFYGDRKFDRVDIICQAGVVAGLALWLTFDNPALGVWTAIVIDMVGLAPTIKHAWQAPHEETAITYALVGIGGSMTILPVLLNGPITVTSIGYPLYAALSLGLLAIMIGIRRKTAAPTPEEATV